MASTENSTDSSVTFGKLFLFIEIQNGGSEKCELLVNFKLKGMCQYI